MYHGVTFLKELLGCQIITATCDIHETTHLFWRLSVTVQHFNPVLFRCSFGAVLCDEKDYV